MAQGACRPPRYCRGITVACILNKDDFALNASEQDLAVEASASIRSDDPCAVNVSVSIISIASATTIVSQRRKLYAYLQ